MEKSMKCTESCEENPQSLSEKVNRESNCCETDETDHSTVVTQCQGDMANRNSEADIKIDNIVIGKDNMDGEAGETVGERGISAKESELKSHRGDIKGNENCAAAEKEKELDSAFRNNDSKTFHAFGSSNVNEVNTQEFTTDKKESFSPETGSLKKNGCSSLPGTPSKTPTRKKLKVHVFEKELFGVKIAENSLEQIQENENNESIKYPIRERRDKLTSQRSLSPGVVGEPLALSSPVNQTESQVVYSAEILEVSSSNTETANLPPTRPNSESLHEQDRSKDKEVLFVKKLVNENLTESENQMSGEVEKEIPLSDNKEDETRMKNLSLNLSASKMSDNTNDVEKLVNSENELSDISKLVCSLSEESLGKESKNSGTVTGNGKVIETSYSTVDESYGSSEDDKESDSMSAVVISPKMTPRDLDHQDNKTEEIILDDSVNKNEIKEGMKVEKKSKEITDREVVLQEDVIEDNGMKVHHEKYDRDLKDEKEEKKLESEEILESTGKDECIEKDAEKEDSCSESPREDARMNVVKEALNDNSSEHVKLEERSMKNISDEVRINFEEEVNDESEDSQKCFDKSSKTTSQKDRMNLNNEFQDDKKRDENSSKDTDEARMYDEKEGGSSEFADDEEKEDKISGNTTQDVKMDNKKVLNDEYEEREDKSSRNTNEEIKEDAEKEVLNNKSEKYPNNQKKSSKTQDDVKMDFEKDALNNDHSLKGRFVKVDKSNEVKEIISHEKSDEDISEKPEEMLPSNKFDSKDKVSNDKKINSKAGDSMSCNEKLEAQAFDKKPSHDGGQEYFEGSPSENEIQAEENDSIERESDSEEESELVIDDSCENESQEVNVDKDSNGKLENIFDNDHVYQQTSPGENSCEKLQTETATKDNKEKSGDCGQNFQVIDKARKSVDIQPGVTDSKGLESGSKIEEKKRKKKQSILEVCKLDSSKNTDTYTEKVHERDRSKVYSKKIHDLRAVTAKSKRNAICEDDEDFSLKAKISKNKIDKSYTKNSRQKLPSNSQEIECVASEKIKEKVQFINLSSDEENDSLDQPIPTKPKVCHRCCDIWNDEVLRLIFKGTECVTVNSKITYGAIVLINNWINRNVSGDKKQVITSVFERADLGKNIAKLNISKLDHWLDQLLNSKTIKCCDVFTAVYCSDKKLGQLTSPKSKRRRSQVYVVPSSPSKSSSVTQHIDSTKNITAVPTNTLAPSQTNQGVRLCGVAPSERIALLQSSVSSESNITLKPAMQTNLQPYHVVMPGNTSSVPVTPHVMLPSVIHLNIPVSASGLPIHLPQSSSQPEVLYSVNSLLGQNVSPTQASSAMSFNPKIENIMSMAKSSSATKDLTGDSSGTSSLPEKLNVKTAKPGSSGTAGNVTSRLVKSTPRKKKSKTSSVKSNSKSCSVSTPVFPSEAELLETPATSPLTSKKLHSVEMISTIKKDSNKGHKKTITLKKQAPIKVSPNKKNKSVMNTRAVEDEQLCDTLGDSSSDDSVDVSDVVRSYKDNKYIMTNNVSMGKSKNTETIIQRYAGSTNHQSLLETLGLDLKSTNIYMGNMAGSLITNEAMLKNPSAVEKKSLGFSTVMPGYFSMTKEHSALHDLAKEAFNILMFEPHNFNVQKSGKLMPNRFITKRELLTLQNICILNAENPDVNLFYEIFLQILLSRNQVLLIPDSRTLLLTTEEIRKEYNRAKVRNTSIQILNENWDIHNVYCAEDVLLCKGDVGREPTVRDLIILFCTWKNLKKNFPDQEFDDALQALCKHVNLSNVDKIGVCIQCYVKYCRYLYEKKDKDTARAFLDESFYSSSIVASKTKGMITTPGQIALNRLNADEKEIESYINRCKEMQKAALISPSQHVYENLCNELIKLKVKLKNFTAVNDLMKNRIQVVEAKKGSIVKMVKHPQGKYLMRKLRNSIESTHKLFLKRYMDDHTDNKGAKRQKTLGNDDENHLEVSEDEVVSPQIQTLIKNLLGKGVKPEQVKTVINTVLVNFEREVPLTLPSEIWIKNFAEIISACNR